MAVELSLDNGQRQVFSQNEITIGCASRCDFVVPPLDGIYDTHAVIRRVANRWLIESSGPWQLFPAEAHPDTRHWLVAETAIDLATRGPTLHFRIDPTAVVAADRQPISAAQPPKPTPLQAPPQPIATSQPVPVRPSQRPKSPAEFDDHAAPHPDQHGRPFNDPAEGSRSGHASAIPRLGRADTLRRRRSLGFMGFVAEAIKVVLGAAVGLSCSYYIMCRFLPDSALLQIIAAELPANLQPEVIRGEQIGGEQNSDPPQ
ncbi:hypothetical protein EC9_47080 [Rosistilla ulvae]|uniref:FHA domain-containing protein n=1 Tax=Rosistilla ulvae TaxID=1930277 RepID=A0A517M6J8_9BACT|nr:FHA domain-containing protein [Rosistilla ulvae]QDS90499.1 hypothetical protein EC9_47080 [Rosistilla ulvae]